MTTSLSRAVKDFASLDTEFLSAIGPSLLCMEAEALCSLFAALGLKKQALTLLEGHTSGDDEGDNDHSELQRMLEMTEPDEASAV